MVVLVGLNYQWGEFLKVMERTERSAIYNTKSFFGIFIFFSIKCLELVL